VGQAKIGHVWVCVYLDPTRSDADVRLDWKPNKANSIHIGGDIIDWCDCRELLMHEALEASFLINDVCYYKSGEHGLHAYVQFNFSHEVFQRCVKEVNLFMMYMEPKLEAAFKNMYPDKLRIKGLD